ncbi:unnamed protein product [Rotaria socialis]|uniref:Uncharacterized protein n=1 Tax=Rotaria socialis TaxID=392032 RepID=A0A820P089_9BILA|nr:unnamed protein product [Rotaria socialis]
MPQYTKFRPDWLSKTDSEGRNVNKWLQQGEKVSTFKCTACHTSDLDCSNQGWAAIPPPSTDGAISIPQLKLDSTKRPITFDFQELVTKAEAIWALTVAQRGYSFNSCDEIGDAFCHMFPDSKIAQEFSMQSRKTSVKFVLCFDEQTNNQDRKQLDLLVKYWCYDQGLVVTRYYKSILLGHATAAILKTAIIDSLKSDGLELKQLLMLGRDSPFVNLSLENMIENEMKKIGCGLLKLGGCHLHVAHNGFKAGNYKKFR